MDCSFALWDEFINAGMHREHCWHAKCENHIPPVLDSFIGRILGTVKYHSKRYELWLYDSYFNHQPMDNHRLRYLAPEWTEKLFACALYWMKSLDSFHSTDK
jgi:hypothetical protein